MKIPCTKIQEQIIDLLLGNLDQQQTQTVHQHLDSCSVCQSYEQTLRNQEKELEDMGTQLTNNLQEKQNKAIEAIQNLPNVKPTHWPLLKYAAAAIIIIASVLSLTLFNITLPQAYALEDTIEAYSSIRWLHIKESASVFEEIRASEIWLECNEPRTITKMRFQSDDDGHSIGPLVSVGNLESSESWLKKHNLRLVGYGALKPSIFLRYDISELAPGVIFDRLYEQEKRGEVLVDIREPTKKSEPIVVTVTYPEGSKSETWKKVFYVDQTTKLVLKVDKYGLRSKGFEHIKTLEFLDYNQPIDPMMFTLDGDVPADVKVIDMSEVEIGMPQGDMTDQEIAQKVTRDFFEAVIAKDFYRAGQLYLGAPDFLVEQAFLGINALKIISIGPGHRDTDPDSNAMNCSCRVLVECGGQHHVLNAWMVRISRADNDTDRWVISGTAINTRPAGGLTLSRDGTDLNAVVYNGLARDQFMKKWLILDPIQIEANEDSNAPSEQTQEDAFAADQVDVSNFQETINAFGKEHQWLLLENKYEIFDLTDEFGESSMITYAWAQIEMPQEKEAVLGIGSDDGVKVWLNGELVHEYWVCRGVGVDNDRVPVTFKKGMNQLVLKIQNQGGSWGFCCRLLDE